MNDEEFELLIIAALKKYGKNYIDESELDYTPHKFSKSFEKKMEKLIKYGCGEPVVHYKKITAKRLFICVTAAIIAACVMALSVSAVRKAFVNFITNIFSTHTEVLSVQDDSAPLEFIDKYEITSDLSDFELVSYTEGIADIEFIYEREHCTLHFTQSIKEYYNVSENTEGYEMEPVYINGAEGYYIDAYNQYGKSIAWDNGDYVLSIFAAADNEYEFSKDELILLAKSVQKVEN